MKKILIIFLIISIVSILVYFIFSLFNNTTKNIQTNKNNSNEYQAYRISTENKNINANQVKEETSKKGTETELYSFSTPLKSKDTNRLTNIQITCSRINETIVKADTEFSFCDIVGKPTSNDGYKEADVISNGKTIKAIGGRKLSSKYNYL